MKTGSSGNNVQWLRRQVARWSMAAAIAVLAIVGRQLLTPVFGSAYTYILFFPAIMIVATLSGVWPGFVVTALFSLVSLAWFLPQPMTAAHTIALLLFLLNGVLMTAVAGLYRKSQRSMRQSQIRLQALIQSAMDAVITVDARQRVVLFNPAAERMFGCTSQEALGSSLDRFIPAAVREAHRRHVEEFGRTGATTRRMGALGSLSGLRANGQEFPIEASISHSELGNQKLFTVILRDVTERKRADEALQQAHQQLGDHAVQLESLVQARTAKLQAAVNELEAFSYSVAHDLRSPLRAMHGYSQALLDQNASPMSAQHRTYLQRIQRAATRLDRLTQEVLSYSRMSRENVSLEPVDLDMLARELVDHYPELAANASNIQIRSPLLPVIGHEGFLTQALSNLLVNACKFIAPGATPSVVVRTEAIGEDVLLWVEDRGIGIRPEHRHRLFQIFGRIHPEYKYEGTGIGLAIVKKSAERMGGSVGFNSLPDQGSQFWLQLPAAAPTLRH